MSSFQYYYSLNGGPAQGPFDIVQLLEKIDADAMVWRDGIDWMPAHDVPELKKFFPSTIHQAPKPVPKPSKSLDELLVEELIDFEVNNTQVGLRKMQVKGFIDFKKWSNFSNQYDPRIIGPFEDSLVYYDGTVFGKGDDGFLMTKNAFCWKNSFQNPMNTFNHKKVSGFQPLAETIRFSSGISSITVVNKASEHIHDGGFKVSTSFISDTKNLAKSLNKLLKLLKSQS